MGVRKRQQGFILIATLFTTLMMAVLIVGFMRVTTVDLQVMTNHAQSLKAYYVAEAGVARALDALRQNGAMADTQWVSTFPAGSSDYYDARLSQNATRIESVGTATNLGFQRALEVDVQVTGEAAPYTVVIQLWKEVIP